MRRSFATLLLLIAVAVALWGCDAQNLPTAAPATSVAPTALATAGNRPPEPPLRSTDTPAPPSDTPTVNAEAPSPTEPPSTQEPSPTASEEPPTRTPRATLSPVATVTSRPTRTPTEASLTPRATNEKTGATPTLGSTETAPTGDMHEVVRVAPGMHRIALTFDAGASGEPWPKILAAFRERNLHITMFITGKFAEQYPDAIRQAIADGHEIANHTYSHLDSRNLSNEQLTEELARTENIIQNLVGATTKPYWRAPFGARNNHVLNVAASQGYRSIYWTLDSLDSVGQPKTADFIFNRVTNTPGVNLDGAIILQHFGSEPSADALPRELDRLQEMGLQVVTISQLLAP